MSRHNVSLSEIASIVQGGRLKLSGHHFVDEGYPAYGAGGLNGYLDQAEFDQPAVVLSSIGARCGKCFFAEGKWTSLANTQVILPDKEKADVRFLWYQLNDENRWHKSGSAQPFIKPSDVKAHQIYLPGLSEQRRIAAILDKADALRAKRREGIAKLDQLLKSVFLDMFGDPIENPKSWPELPLGDLASSTKIGMVRAASEFGEDFDVPYVRMDAVSADGKFLPEKVKKTNATEAELRDYALESGDLLFNTRNSKELVGKTCVYDGPAGWTFNNNLMRIRFRGGIAASVMAAQFQFARVKQALEKRKSGTTSVYAVYWRELQSLPLLVPPPAQQQRFASISKEIEVRKHKLRSHASQLDTLFSSLQRRAFTGTL